MAALAVIEADTCPSCSGALSETTDVANDEKYEPIAIRCHRCSAIATFQEKKDEFAEPRSALLWTATLKR